MVYRKSLQGDMWHCCRNCTHWPERRGAYIERNEGARESGGEWLGRGTALRQQSTSELNDLDY